MIIGFVFELGIGDICSEHGNKPGVRSLHHDDLRGKSCRRIGDIHRYPRCIFHSRRGTGKLAGKGSSPGTDILGTGRSFRRTRQGMSILSTISQHLKFLLLYLCAGNSERSCERK